MTAIVPMWFQLIVIFQLKHFFVDYIFQTGMAKFSYDWRVWIPGLIVHAGHHVIGTFIILYFFCDCDLFLACNLSSFNGIVHFMMDRLKASPHMWNKPERFMHILYTEQAENPGVYVKTKPEYWWALGFDQLIHHLTDAVCILWVV